MISNDPSRLESGTMSERGRTVSEPSRMPERGEIRTTAEVVASASSLTALAGGGAVALTIIALAGVLPTYLGPIAAIVLGGGLMMEAAGVAARYERLAQETYDSEHGNLTLGGGAGVDFLGGAAGVALGILALVGVMPSTLLACAVISLGASIVIGSSALVRLNHLVIAGSSAHPTAQHAAREAVSASAGTHVLVGLAAGTLGILALCGLVPETLNLVGLLSIGAGLLLSGSAVASRMISVIAR